MKKTLAVCILLFILAVPVVTTTYSHALAATDTVAEDTQEVGLLSSKIVELQRILIALLQQLIVLLQSSVLSPAPDPAPTPDPTSVCHTEYEGYVYSTSLGKCVFENTTSCDDPFEYKTKEACESNQGPNAAAFFTPPATIELKEGQSVATAAVVIWLDVVTMTCEADLRGYDGDGGCALNANISIENPQLELQRFSYILNEGASVNVPVHNLRITAKSISDQSASFFIEKLDASDDTATQ